MIYPEGIEALEKEMKEKDPFEKHRNDPDPEKRKRADAWVLVLDCKPLTG